MPRWLRDLLVSLAGSLLAGLAIASSIKYLLPPKWTTIFLIGSGTLFLLIILLLLRRRRTASDNEPFVGSSEELVMNLDRLAQESFTQGERLFINTALNFEHIVATYEIQGFGASYTVSYTGRNVGRRASRSIVRMVGGDSAVDRGLLRLRVTDLAERRELHWEFVKEEETPFRKPVRIFFPQPLEKGDSFDIKLMCQWPGTFARRQDYVFFPVHHFKRGLENLTLCVTLPSRPLHYEGVELRGRRYRIARIQPTLKEVGRRWAIAATLKGPRELYAIWFTRSDI